jgi:hypothetical protein
MFLVLHREKVGF